MTVMQSSRSLLAGMLLIVSLPTQSETLKSLVDAGHEKLWSGYAAITTCVSGKDRYSLGPYVFVCEGHDYPYHYGMATLVGRSFDYQGQRVVLTYLCLDEGKSCLSGKVLRQH